MGARGILLLGFTLVACGHEAHVDGGVDSGSDAGPGLDAAPADAALHDGGATLLVTIDEGLAFPVHLASDLGELFYIQNNHLRSVSLKGDKAVRDLGPAPGAASDNAAFDVMYLYYDLETSPFSGTIRRLDGTKTATPTELARRASILAFSPDWTHVVAIENLSLNVGSTLTADLMGLRGVPVGMWDEEKHALSGSCVPSAVFTSSVTAMVSGCLAATSSTAHSVPHVLMRADLSGAAPLRIVARNVIGPVVVGADLSYVLYLDEGRRLWGIDRSGTDPKIIADTASVASVLALPGRRFVYATFGRALKIASWPAMVPREILRNGAGAPERATGDGAFLMYRRTLTDSGLRDLYLVPTSTDASPTVLPLDIFTDGVPGQTAFTADGKQALWLSNVSFDQNLPLGDALSRTTDGTSEVRTLATFTSGIRAYGSGTSVMILANTRCDFDDFGTFIPFADLAIRRADGSGPLEIIARGLDPRTVRLRGATVVYRVPPGKEAGLWINTLPAD